MNWADSVSEFTINNICADTSLSLPFVLNFKTRNKQHGCKYVFVLFVLFFLNTPHLTHLHYNKYTIEKNITLSIKHNTSFAHLVHEWILDFDQVALVPLGAFIVSHWYLGKVRHEIINTGELNLFIPEAQTPDFKICCCNIQICELSLHVWYLFVFFCMLSNILAIMF